MGFKDLSGQRFGRLVAVERIPEKARSGYKWKCRCDCGKTCAVLTASLLGGRTKSCGCLQAEVSAMQHRPIMQEGTNVSSIRCDTLYATSTTGVRGVSCVKSGKYRVYITMQKKRYHIGTYSTLEEAIKARKRAEEEHFQAFLEKRKNPAEE